jgi:lipid A ethanolaminephosphotransferase
MFSFLGEKGNDKELANSQDNVLDVLKRAGVNVLWRDNNSDSKGVALNVEYQDYKTNATNTMCDVECRDKGMIVGLQKYIDSKKSGDILIVLHQMGNHGPAYSKRYPAEYEKFKPTCKTNQLEQCSKEEVSNAYDNALLYTDSFLRDTIDLLKKNNNFDTKMVYMSDHGESLGEAGVYLHGMPKIIAPQAQTHVGMVFWSADKNLTGKIMEIAKENYSHFNLPHMLLGMFHINTELYNKSLDILKK